MDCKVFIKDFDPLLIFMANLIKKFHVVLKQDSEGQAQNSE
jgi:hypothetical protein